MADDGMTYEEAQEAVDNGDDVTASELNEMHPDKTMNQIMFDISKEQSQMEYEHKLEQKYEFNEPRMAAKQGRKTCHTGPKGVITDFEEAKLKMRAFRIDDKIQRESKKYMSLDNASNETAHKFTIIDLKAAKPTKKQLRREHIGTESKSQEAADDDIDSSDDLLDDEEEDEAALQRYKLQKMQILKDNQARYGNTLELTAWTFEKEVDEAPRNVFVVVHVYQDVS